MDTLSAEQQFILDNITNGKNIVVDAVAGSGKSTTVLSIAKQNPDKKVLQLTYNASLRTEIKEKVRNLELQNLTIHTYHSLAVRYYLATAYTDTGLRYILHSNMPCSHTIPLYDIIVIDEAQDMSIVYYKMVVKFIQDLVGESEHRIQLAVLGDVKQGLYEFKGSDIRFLSLAKTIWRTKSFLKTDEFVECTMKMSYRVTDQIKHFVNNAMLGNNRMDSCRNGEPIQYIRNSRPNLERIVVHEIGRLIESGVKASDIFVLGGSVKGANSNIRKMENAMVSKGIPCFVPMLESADKMDDRVIDGKVVFSTFHCVKGRQRPYVFIIGFDNSYFDYYARSIPKDVCPNTLYVGATRASQCLYLLESDQYSTDRPLEFLQKTHHEMKADPHIQFKGIPRTLFYKRETGSNCSQLIEKHYNTPTDMIKFIPESIIEDITNIINRIFIKVPVLDDSYEIDIPSVIKTRQGFYEEISDLNGIAIPNMYYDFFLHDNKNLEQEEEGEGEEKPCILFSMIQENKKELKENQHHFLHEIIDNLPQKCESIHDYLYLANVYVATQERLYFKLKQIDRDEYTWITDATMNKCKDLLQDTIGKECDNNKKPIIESTIIHHSDDEDHIKIDALMAEHFHIHEKFRFTARVDLITESTIWELKCTSSLSIDHLLQVVIYAWLWNMTHDEPKEFKILNIKTGECMVLQSTMEDLNSIIIPILKGKYDILDILTDEEFIESTI